MNNNETMKPQQVGGSELNYGLGWININVRTPDILPLKNCSDNVWATDGTQIYVANYFNDGEGWCWANCYGDVFGDAEFDDDYDIKYWQPIAVPVLPNANLRCAIDSGKASP